MDNSLPHQETLARMYELRDMLSLGPETGAMALPLTGREEHCGDCGRLCRTRSYGRVDVCYDCLVARLGVAQKLIGDDAA